MAIELLLFWSVWLSPMPCSVSKIWQTCSLRFSRNWLSIYLFFCFKTHTVKSATLGSILQIRQLGLRQSDTFPKPHYGRYGILTQAFLFQIQLIWLHTLSLPAKCLFSFSFMVLREEKKSMHSHTNSESTPEPFLQNVSLQWQKLLDCCLEATCWASLHLMHM